MSGIYLGISTVIGAVVLGALLVAATILLIAVTSMMIGLAVTARRRAAGDRVEPKPFRAESGVWAFRWARFLRHVLRQHHQVSGEREHIARVGLPAYLWADDVRRGPLTAGDDS